MLSNHQIMWTKSVVADFKRQRSVGVSNPSLYFELAFLGNVPPEKVTDDFKKESKELFLENIKEEV